MLIGGAVIRAKPGTELQIEPGVFVNYWRTIKPVVTSQVHKFRPMSGWNGTVGCRSAFQFITPLH